MLWAGSSDRGELGSTEVSVLVPCSCCSFTPPAARCKKWLSAANSCNTGKLPNKAAVQLSNLQYLVEQMRPFGTAQGSDWSQRSNHTSHQTLASCPHGEGSRIWTGARGTAFSRDGNDDPRLSPSSRSTSAGTTLGSLLTAGALGSGPSVPPLVFASCLLTFMPWSKSRPCSPKQTDTTQRGLWLLQAPFFLPLLFMLPAPNPSAALTGPAKKLLHFTRSNAARFTSSCTGCCRCLGRSSYHCCHVQEIPVWLSHWCTHKISHIFFIYLSWPGREPPLPQPPRPFSSDHAKPAGNGGDEAAQALLKTKS